MKKMLFIFILLFAAQTYGWAKQTAVSSDFEQIRPVLEQKCAICHASVAVKRPFSSKIPVWNFAAGANVKLARKKYDIDGLLKDGKFASEGHLKMLEHTILKKNMPPFQYRLFHAKKRISAEEREAILAWIYSVHPEWKTKNQD
ncbi:MAG: heme-binding domain-containing protein [Candidatus Omnitrophica bacterium]|nr:heme-binding domain-containing protein [Candidatus Omnitrophota bacterium]